MAKRKSASVAETKWAMAILHALGVRDNKEPNLLVGIIAWLRAEGGLKGLGGKYNNPLNLHLSPYAHGYAKYNNGTYSFPIAKFKSMNEAAKAYAWYIKQGVSGDRSNFDAFLAAVRRPAGTEKQRGERLEDVLIAIAEMGWSGRKYFNHYGFEYGRNGGTLFEIVSKIGGVTFPAVYQKQKKVENKVRVIPAPPRQLQPPSMKRNYGDPWAAGEFYRGRGHFYAYTQDGLNAPERVD